MLDRAISAVFARLEAEDAEDAIHGGERSLAIAPTTGALLYALCVRQPGCRVLEIGGSRGYSTIWLAAAVRDRGGHVVSLEENPSKIALAASNLADAGVADIVELRPGDAFATLRDLDAPFDVVFLDAWKDDYEALFALARPLLAAGGLVVADNVLSHAETLAPYCAARQSDPTLLSVTVPLDNGLELTSVLGRSLHSV